MTKVKLNALIFSIGDYLAIRDWYESNHQVFDVEMPAGIACAPLTRVIYLPDILNSDNDGVLIADHRKYFDDQISMVIRQLRLRDKWLFSVTNGLVPVCYANMGSVRASAVFVDTPILKVLKDCRQALRWLNEKGPTQWLPGKYAAPVRCLENLGFVFRRNNKTFSLRRHRLRKVLEHESKKLTVPCRIDDLLRA